MYYTHGDMVIYRSDRPERTPQRPRVRTPEREPGERPVEPSTKQVLLRRVSELEERLARLEAELEEARPGGRPAQRQAHEAGPRQHPRSSEVKVSLHAEGGTQATVGPVRMVSQD
ncbi:MAG: hypothetical protein ACOY94_05875 [Bacillota bacterium]